VKYKFTDYCVCPRCRGDLVEQDQALFCAACNKNYPIIENIPVLLPDYEDSVGERYHQNYEKIANNFLATNKYADDNVAGRHKILLNFIGTRQRGKRILDIGSSHGLYLDTIEAEFKVAFDIASTYLKVIPASTGIVPIQGDAEKLPFKAGFFDIIIIADILEHILHPEKLIEILFNNCGKDTKIIVHIPWEEDLSKYKDAPYEFSHVRNFTMYTFVTMWYKFDLIRYKDTFPALFTPFVFSLEHILPLFLFKQLVKAYYFVPGLSQKDADWRMKRIAMIPKGEWWLLWFYKPVFRIFELRVRKSLLERSLRSFKLASRMFNERFGKNER
jgi:uncharacterized protein YbaR (Trm112 family)